MSKSVIIASSSCLLVFLLLAAGPLFAAQFTADMLQARQGEKSTSKLFVKGDQYRMEMQQGGTEFIVLVNRETGITRVLMPGEKKYMQMANTSARSQMNNPFESFRHSSKKYERKELGREELKGFDCSKVLVGSGEQDLFTAWISQELEFPLKIIFHLQQGMFVELKNIRQSQVDASLFDIPQDYSEMKREKGQKRAARPAKRKSEEASVEKKELTASEKLVLNKLEEQGIQKVNKRGTLATFKHDNPVLQEYFPEWKFYRLTRVNPRRPIAGGISYGVVSADNTVYILKDIMTSGKMEDALMSMLEKGDIRLKDPEDVSKFARMLDALYHKGSDGVNIVSLKDNQWAIYTGSFLEYYKGFQIRVDADGRIEELKYDLKLKEKESSQGPGPAKQEKIKSRASASVQGSSSTATSSQAQAGEDQDQPEQVGTVSGTGQEHGRGAGRSGSSVAASQSQGSSRTVNMMFILDASGSMWGEVEGRDKIAIAKEVMAKLIRDLPDTTRAGLVAYGHRRKGDCQDVEELVSIGPLDKEDLIQTIQDLSPKGKTPITRSVRMTAEKLKAMEDETTIILVSDGKETCEGDPCALVQELKEAGLRFVLHVIGFDVTQEEREQLECMAEAGGGKYFTAKTAGEFQAAAQEVVQETKTVGFLEVMALRNDEPVPARVEVLDQETGELVRTAKTSRKGDKPAVLRLKPGIYRVEFIDEGLPGQPSRSFSDVGIELGLSVSRTARFEAGSLELSAIKEGKRIHAHARVYKGDELVTSGWLEEGQGRTFSLLPGVYRVEVRDTSIPDEPVVSLDDIEITSGQLTSRQVNFSREGLLRVEAMKAGKSIHAHAVVYQGGDRVTSGWLKEGEGASFKLLPGVYRVEIQDKKIPQEPVVVLEEVAVQPGQTVSRQARFPQPGQLTLEAFKGGKSIHVYAEVYQEGDRVASDWLEEGEGSTFKLLPGSYRVVVKDKSIPQEPEVILNEVEIQSGRTQSKQAQFAQEGQLKVEAFQGGTSLHVYAKVYIDDDRVAFGWLEKGQGRTFKLLPGTYRIEVKGPDDELKEQKGISIQSGQTTSVDIQF